MKVEHIEVKPFQWTFKFGNNGGACDVDIYRGKETTALMLTDRYPGCSVTNGIERIVTLLVKDYALYHDAVLFLEQHPQEEKGKGRDPRWILVRMKYDKKEREYHHPGWITIKEDIAKALIKIGPKLNNRKDLARLSNMIFETRPMETSLFV